MNGTFTSSGCLCYQFAQLQQGTYFTSWDSQTSPKHVMIVVGQLQGISCSWAVAKRESFATADFATTDLWSLLVRVCCWRPVKPGELLHNCGLIHLGSTGVVASVYCYFSSGALCLFELVGSCVVIKVSAVTFWMSLPELKLSLLEKFHYKLCGHDCKWQF